MHLTNNLLFDSVASRRTVFIGSPTVQNQVEVKLDSGGTFSVGPTDTLVLLNRVSGAGLFKTGDGTLVLRGANTYVGGTSIDGGVVEVSADNSLGAAPGVPTDNLFFSTETRSHQVSSGSRLRSTSTQIAQSKSISEPGVESTQTVSTPLMPAASAAMPQIFPFKRSVPASCD